MQRHFISTVGWIISAAFLISGVAATTEPPLRAFGYGNMTTKRAIPLAIILVNFTNDVVETESTLPYKMGSNLVGSDYAGAEQYYSNWFFSRTLSPQSVNGYFLEISNGRFQWLHGGVFMVLMDTNNLHAAFMDRTGDGGKADVQYMTLMIQQAMKQGFDPVGFNADGNQVVTSQECAIQLYTNDKTFGGGARVETMPLTTGFPPIFYNDYVAIQHYDLGMRVVAEELIHVLQDDHCGDIYGPSSMSHGFSTMSANGGASLHVDAWHKLQLGWSEPRVQSMSQGGLLDLPAAQLREANGPVVLYDPSDTNRNDREFFMLEYRTSSVQGLGEGYDKDVADSGLVIWHIQQNPLSNDPLDYTPTYFPFAERHWYRCTNCFGLYYTQGSQFCPSSQNNHIAIDGHIRMPFDNPKVGGVPGWRYCKECGQLFYLPNVSLSVCKVNGQTHVPGTGDYRLRRDDDPESLGQRGWSHCGKCQCLFHEIDGNRGVCAAGGAHEVAEGTSTYALMWGEGVRTMMIEGSPKLSRSQGGAWHGGDLVPTLRWFDGSLSRTRIKVYAFSPGDDRITIEIMPHYDTWVDFGYTGEEDGSFERPRNTFGEGVDAVYPEGVLHLKAGSTPEKRKVTKPMRMEAFGGSVTIGRP
jgi:M6 family metalloprotease-like protein